MLKTFLVSNYMFSYEFRFQLTERVLNYYEVPFSDNADVIRTVSESELNRESSGYSLEYQESLHILSEISKKIIYTNASVFHGVALRILGKNYIITARSGTGKTTQYKNLKTLYGSDIQILNGDKPILNFSKEEHIMIDPSPWSGKEGWATELGGELSGIIVLKQAKENRIRKLDKAVAVPLVLKRFLCVPDSVEKIRILCNMTEMLLDNCPVWLMENLGDYDSSRLLYDTLIEYQENINV